MQNEKPIVDWLAVEADYRAGAMSIRDIGAKHGVPKSTIDQKAKREGWMRNPNGLKAERFRAATVARTESGLDASQQIDKEIERDLIFHDKSIRFFERSLDLAAADLETEGLSPRDRKILTETTQINVTMYRKLRGLDQVSGGKTLEDLLGELGE